MTNVIIYKSKNYINGFEIAGHSGYAEEGADIVCSAVSAIAQMVVVGIREVLKLDAFYEMSDGYLKLRLDKSYESESVQVLFNAMHQTLKDISNQYRNYVKLEVKKDVY